MSERSSSRPLRPLAAAVTFLTAVPVGRDLHLDERDLRRGAAWFPLVGGAVGASVAATAWAAAHVLPATASAVLGIAAGVALTAAFHLDGLGDVADGIGAALTGRAPADVMRDPRLGTFGVAAVALDLLLKGSLLAALADGGFPWTVAGAGAVARVAPIALAWRLPYEGGGTGGWVRDVGVRTVGAATAIALCVAAPASRLATVGMLVACALVCTFLGGWSRRHLGGVTGDVFGAAAELTDTLALAVAVAVARVGTA